MRTHTTILALLLATITLTGCGADEPEPKTDAGATTPDPQRQKGLATMIPDEATLGVAVGEHVFSEKRPALFIGRVRLVPAGDGTAASLFANRDVTTLKERITLWAGPEGEAVTAHGVYEGAGISIPFSRQIVLPNEGRPFRIVEVAEFDKLPVTFALAEHSLVLPLKVAKDEHHRMFAFGGASRVEMFRMDMNDQSRRSQNISDNRGYRPYWDIGCVLQLPTGYQIWRANHADTRRYVVEEGKGAPGWADYSETDAGFTVKVEDAQTSAPWSMLIDARKGAFVISPRPADQPPISGVDYGKRTFTFTVMLHETSWPALHPCELPVEKYKVLLDSLNAGKGHNNLRYAAGALGITVGRTKEEIHRAFIDTERVQPSVLLRLLYRGDAWRMANVVKDLLGKSVSRNQPFEKWEAINREIIAKLRAEGVPAASK